MPVLRVMYSWEKRIENFKPITRNMLPFASFICSVCNNMALQDFSTILTLIHVCAKWHIHKSIIKCTRSFFCTVHQKDMPCRDTTCDSFSNFSLWVAVYSNGASICISICRILTEMVCTEFNNATNFSPGHPYYKVLNLFWVTGSPSLPQNVVTPRGNLKSLNTACLLCVGGNRSPKRKPTQILKLAESPPQLHNIS